MRKLIVTISLFLLGLLSAPVARAEQPRCPLPLDECLLRFDLMKVRPWLGVEFVPDSTERTYVVRTVRPGGPAERAGVQPGDRVERVDGRTPQEWFAARAGWRTNGDAPLAVVRGGTPRTLRLPLEVMPDDVLARVVGTHMLEGHLAWMHDDAEPHVH